ncbi:hypothetical protein J6590_011481 [Homalodisca vitripennis]|nr:hypothetical protein J6590_011481 [Homalodisca vitripennis]
MDYKNLTGYKETRPQFLQPEIRSRRHSDSGKQECKSTADPSTDARHTVSLSIAHDNDSEYNAERTADVQKGSNRPTRRYSGAR